MTTGADREAEPGTGPSGLALTKAAFDALPMQTAILDSDGRIVWTNEAWERFARENGLDGVDMIGTDYLAVGERADSRIASEATAGIRAVLDGESESFSREYPCHSPNEQRWFEMSVYPIDGLESRHALVQHENVTTERHNRQAARERDQLESVAQILSHDLKSPLNVALERSKLIDERDARHAEEIERALRRMDTLIEDALFLSQANTVEDPRPVDLAARVEDARVGLDLDVTVVATDAPVVAGEGSLLTQLFENLLRNAAEHAARDRVLSGGDDGSDPPRVTVGAGPDGFYVEDDGPGIPPEERPTIFQPGYASGTTGGTGLGLAIVERIATAHGWSVSVTDGADGGARFVFSEVDRLERTSDGVE